MIADAVVVGGGIAGVSAAFHLAEAGLKHVVLLERESLLGTSSSAASAGVIHHQFPEQVNRSLSKASLKALEGFEARFDVRIDFRRNGYLQTAGTEEDLAELRRMHEALLSAGVDAQMPAPAELAELIPGLFVDDLRGAVFTPSDGWFDPHGVIQGYAEAARNLGATISAGMPAVDLVTDGGKIEGVRTPAETIATRIVVDAAGPFAAGIAARIGVHVPILTVKRQIFVSAPTRIISSDAPFYFDRTPPLYFRPESGGLLMSIAEMEQYPPGDARLDWRSAEILAQRATGRMPAFSSLQLVRGWAGLRSMTPDSTAVLGPVPEPEGFYMAAGFSGHGVMHSPMTGKIVVAMIMEPDISRLDDIDLAPLRIDRFMK